MLSAKKDRAPSSDARCAAPSSSALALRLWALLLAGAALVTGGCGPVLYTVNGIPATATLSEAQAERAERFAPYEFFLASAYLEKAREEAAQAHYQDANHFAEVASEAAGRARDIARERRRASSR